LQPSALAGIFAGWLILPRGNVTRFVNDQLQRSREDTNIYFNITTMKVILRLQRKLSSDYNVSYPQTTTKGTLQNLVM